MDKGSLGARDQRAQERMVRTATTLAERFGVVMPSTLLAAVQAKDPAVKAMFQREAVADLLERLVDATAMKTYGTNQTAETKTDPEPTEVEVVAETTRRNRKAAA